MNNPKRAYEFLLTQFERLTINDISKALKLGYTSTHAALTSLENNKNVDISVKKTHDGGKGKLIITYILTERKPIGEVFGKTMGEILIEILIEILKANPKPLTFEEVVGLSGGQLTFKQVKNCTGKVIERKYEHVVKTKRGRLTALQLVAKEPKKELNNYMAREVDTLFNGSPFNAGLLVAQYKHMIEVMR